MIYIIYILVGDEGRREGGGREGGRERENKRKRLGG